MKIIFLNALNGDQEQEFRSFLAEHASDTDIFCFQEAYEKMQTIANDYLKDYKKVTHYELAYKHKDYIEDFALATYVHRSIELISSTSVFHLGEVRGLALDTEVAVGGGSVHIINYHGDSQPGDKIDTPTRVRQSLELRDYLSSITNSIILGGDFNFLPTTESYRTIHEVMDEELVMDRRIPTTLNRLYWMAGRRRLMHSDYVFMRGNITCDSLTAPLLEVSDHLPLIMQVTFMKNSYTNPKQGS